MDSRSRRLPFCLSSSRSSYTTSPSLSSSSSSSPSSSSSSLGASRLYSPAPVLNHDRFPRASSTYKAELDQQNSRLLSSSRDYSSDGHSSSWKLPTSLTSSSRSYDRPWAESSLNSRSKLTESEGRLGMCSGLLNPTDDGDSKRAKLSYNNRGLYSRTSSSSVTGSTYNSSGIGSGRGVGEKQSDTFDSSWSSCRLLPRSSLSSSNSLLSRREQEMKNEPRVLNLGERRIRSPAAASSLYQTDRVTSTYAQGARPKETTYSSLSSRESSLNRHLSSSSSSSSSHRSSPLVHNLSSRTTTRPSDGISSLYSSQEQRGPDSSSYSSSSHPPWYSSSSSHLPRPEASLPPRPAPEGEPEGRRSTRRLLSRLFSRRSSQDSSSGSSSVRSIDDDTPSTGGESVDSDEGARTASMEPEGSGPEMTLGGIRSRRADLAPIQENNDAYRSGLTRSRMASWREPAVGSDNTNGGSSGSSWISSSLRSRCPPLLSRLRRHVRDESSHPVAGLEEGYNGPQRLLRRWDDLELKASQDDDDDDDEEEEEENDEEEGAVGLDAFGSARRSCRLDAETLPELEDAATEFSPRRRAMAASYENMSVPLSRLSGATENQDQNKTVSSRDQEKLRKIKERLLMEESDEEEGDLCRICQMGEESASNPLIQPCRCTGSLQFVHQECIKRWLRSKIGSGTNLEAITTCELCKEKLRLNIDNFDIQELYRTHVQSEYDEFISSGLYLVVLLHFCEQRFSDVLGAVDAAGLFNLVRILHEHMDNLQSSHGESDDDVRETRPSIEFSDLDDDLEEEY